MVKEKIKFTDYDGNEREEEFYFNLTKAEVTEMELSENGGMSKMLERLVVEKDNKKIITIFKDFLLKSYGKKSPDGRQFIKNEEITNSFMQTEAYSILFMKLASDAEFAAKFVNGVLPKIETQK